MSDRIWQPENRQTWPNFLERLEMQDYRLDGLLYPVQQARREGMADFAPVKRAVTPFVTRIDISEPQPSAKVRRLAYPHDQERLRFRPRAFPGRFCDLHQELVAAGDAIVYFRFRFTVKRAGQVNLLLGYDGPVRVWLDRRCLYTDPNGANPARPDRSAVRFRAHRGRHEFLIALASDHGRAWGIFARLERVHKRVGPDDPAMDLAEMPAR
jgi:hypothetical protein